MKTISKKLITGGVLIWMGRQRAQQFVYKNSNMILFGVGCAMLHFGVVEVLMAQTDPNAVTFDTTEIDRATCSMYALLEGPYGALLTATAGFSALVAAVTGSYQTAYNFLAVGVGCFIARSVNSMYFDEVQCEEGLNQAISDFYQNEGAGIKAN